MSTAETLITAEEFMQMSFDHPVELVRGEIVHMPPPKQPHGAVVANVVFALETWARSDRSGRTTCNDSAVQTAREPDTVRGADACFFGREKVDRGALTDEGREIPPDLCVEVSWDSNTWSEVSEKIEEYLDCGVVEVWIVDPELKTVQVFRRDAPFRTVHADERLTSDLLPEFACNVAEFFDLT